VPVTVSAGRPGIVIAKRCNDALPTIGQDQCLAVIGQAPLVLPCDPGGLGWSITLDKGRDVFDYRKYDYTITQQMVDDTKSYIANQKYKKPAEDITLIED